MPDAQSFYINHPLYEVKLSTLLEQLVSGSSYSISKPQSPHHGSSLKIQWVRNMHNGEKWGQQLYPAVKTGKVNQ